MGSTKNGNKKKHLEFVTKQKMMETQGVDEAASGERETSTDPRAGVAVKIEAGRGSKDMLLYIHLSRYQSRLWFLHVNAIST